MLVAEVGAEFRPQLTLSLDVIFHLVEDRVYNEYMSMLFSTCSQYVIIYSSNGNCGVNAVHMRNVKFSDWIDENAQEYRLVKHAKNIYPYDEDRPNDTSFCDFYVYEGPQI